MLKQIVVAMLLGFSSLFSSEILQKEGPAYLQQAQHQLILHVKGTHYEMGYQHGKLLKEQIARNIATYIDTPKQGSGEKVGNFVQQIPKVLSYVSDAYKEQMRGIADGSGQPLQKILILNLFPEMFHCSGITVKGNATEDQSLYHVRVLDYAIGKDLQSTAVLIVAEPQEGHTFINVSYAGFIGSITGMNEQKISIGEIGGQGYGLWDGVPMAFLMREILEKASTLADVKNILLNAKRTCEYYYIIADGKDSSSFGAYATPSQVQFIEPGSSYALLAPSSLPDHYGKNGENDKFFLTDCKELSSPYQTVLVQTSGTVAALFHRQPQECLLLTGYSHEERYPILAERVQEAYGKLNVASLIEVIKQPVSRPTNLHNVVFHPATLELWVAHAGTNNEPACDQPYEYFSLTNLINK